MGISRNRSRRDLVQLFGTYVPPELVDEMVKDPNSYGMQAVAKELTVMFCDMRGFTQMAETMPPTQVQQLLNSMFTHITRIIRSNRGTIDKYMGDCVMAFWGAPVDSRYHAWLAVKTTLEISSALHKLNAEHQHQGLPEVGVGIGLNTGTMCVGDMGSDIRRSYTVIGDAVNLAARLEKLTKTYGVDIIAGEGTRLLARDFSWQELDKVRVKGRDKATTIFRPLATQKETNGEQELQIWGDLLKAYRVQDWDACDLRLDQLQAFQPKSQLYRLYAQRVAAMRMLPFDPLWDGATNFE